MNPRYTSFFAQNTWCHKIAVVIISTCYFITLVFVNDTSYVWVTLALIFILFISTFVCATESPPILLQLRGTRLGEISSRRMAEEENQETQSSSNTRIWMTDIPPSYSFVMSNIPPVTPPPSYGSAILMFPYLNIEANGLKTEATIISEIPNPNTRHPLSISTQVSVSSFISEPQLIRPISFSTQVSVSGTSDLLLETLSLRTQLFLSRQVSVVDASSNDKVSEEENEVNYTPNAPDEPTDQQSNEPIFHISEDSSLSEENTISQEDVNSHKIIFHF